MDSNSILHKAEEASSYLKILAHPVRLLTLCQLVEGDKPVSELHKNSYLSESAFSQHLGILKNEHLVVTYKSAHKVFYKLADEKITCIITLLYKLFCTEKKQDF